MRKPAPVPLHYTTLPRQLPVETEAADAEDQFINRPCYTFNHALRTALDDTRCGHCRHYLTSSCPHIDEFLDDVEDLSPE